MSDPATPIARMIALSRPPTRAAESWLELVRRPEDDDEPAARLACPLSDIKEQIAGITVTGANAPVRRRPLAGKARQHIRRHATCRRREITDLRTGGPGSNGVINDELSEQVPRPRTPSSCWISAAHRALRTSRAAVASRIARWASGRVRRVDQPTRSTRRMSSRCADSLPYVNVVQSPHRPRAMKYADDADDH